MMDVKLEATHIRDRLWAVRPEGQLGTCGWTPEPWTVLYVHASTASVAVQRAVQIKEMLKTKESK